jgi:O-acetyl-ADP-ribose deacetylase (regulator of RNase III)/uncharacterized protein YwgA
MSGIRIKGDIFESDAQTLVNTVNTVGVMGKGVALGFKQRYPDMFEDYRIRCERNRVRLGRPYLFRRLIPPWIINFPTKGHWRSPSRLSDIEAGLEYLVDHLDEWGVESIALPPLGCGNGELEWRVVGPVIYEHMARAGIEVEMFAPFGTPLVQLEKDYLTGQLELMHETGDVAEFKVTPAMAALVAILARLERNPIRAPIGRTSFQKLAYFATQAGLPTDIRFERKYFGPYSKDVEKIKARLLNNALVEEVPLGGQMVSIRVGKAFDRAEGNFALQLNEWRDQIERVVDLFSRLSTQQAELAASVHFATKELLDKGGTVTEGDVFEYVDQWKPAKYAPDDVARTIRALAMLGWLQVEPSPTLPVPEQVA